MVSNVISNFSSCFIHVSPVSRYPTFNFFRACLWEKNNYEYHQAINLKIFSGRHISYTTSSPKKITGSVTQPRKHGWSLPTCIMGSSNIIIQLQFLHKSPTKPKPWVCRARSVLRVQRVPDSTTWCLEFLEAMENFFKGLSLIHKPSKYLKHLCTKNGKIPANQKATSLSISLKSVMGFSSQCHALTFQTSSAAGFFHGNMSLGLGPCE